MPAATGVRFPRLKSETVDLYDGSATARRTRATLSHDYYYDARYYDPVIGRFISPDSIVQAPADPHALNRYSYCRNNPLIYTDPTGHFWQFIIGAAIGAIMSGIQSDWNPQAMLFGGAVGAVSGGAYGGVEGVVAGSLQGVVQNGVLSGAISGAAGGVASGAVSGGLNAAYYGGNVGEGILEVQAMVQLAELLLEHSKGLSRSTLLDRQIGRTVLPPRWTTQQRMQKCPRAGSR